MAWEEKILSEEINVNIGLDLVQNKKACLKAYC